jgi:SAM-dependent MidA family methyltransferase
MYPPEERLRKRIQAQGAIPFAPFMEEALYGEGGYYNRDDLPIGPGGDFVTGSSFSPLFGRATGRLLRRLDGVLGGAAEFFEAGYGSGLHLASLAAVLDGGPAGRRLRAWDRVPRAVPEGVARVDRLRDIGDGEIDGIIFSYELFDALPVHRLIGRDEGGPGELWVDLGASGYWTFRQGELSDSALLFLLRNPDVELLPGQVADLAPTWRGLYCELARKLRRGLLVTCDYGYERPALLDPRVRLHGTLACYTKQRVHRNPFVRIGRQDMTAHVDFSTLIHGGELAGLTTVALTRQALWLLACGVFDDLEAADAATRQEAMALLDGEGMGEDVRVLVQSKGIDPGEVLDLEKLLAPSPAR